MVPRAATCLVLLASVLPCALAQTPTAPVSATGVPSAAPPADSALKTYTVPAGTRILLSLRNEISSRVARPGDPVYFVSDFPVVADGAVVLPAGMYVTGFIDRVQRPGKVKGRAQLQMHFASMIFPNGVEIPIPGSVDNVPGSSGANVKNAEGTVEQSGTKGRDAQTIAGTTMAGTGVGSLVGAGSGNAGMGAGIGAGAGAAAGVLTTLFTRGNDIVFSPGTKLEMELSRPVVVQQTQLAGMPAYTGLNLPAPSAPVEQPLTAEPRPNH